MQEKSHRSFAIMVDNDDVGKRLDTFIASTFPEISRNTASQLIRNGDITVSDTIKKPGYRVNFGDVISCNLPPPKKTLFTAEPVDVDIIFEDPLFLVINKRPGIVVHPSPGHEHGTLAHGLLFHRPQLDGVGGIPARPGIVHRLDRDTSGIMIVAKTEFAYHFLVSQFKERGIRKKYLGIVYGIPDHESGKIILKIGRHASFRKKMTVTDRENARYAETHWKIREKLDRCCLMEFDIKTGRTHQIRVHSAAMKHPIIGDPVYGFRRGYKKFEDSPVLKEAIRSVPRQMLHAWKLSVAHPETDREMCFEVPLPEDMKLFLEKFKTGS